MHPRMSSTRCYTCNDRGHYEGQCPDRYKSKPAGARLRYTKPAFELTIVGLQRVLISDREETELEVQAFGMEVTADALRVMHQGNKIAFFGTPTREHGFALILPNMNQEIRIQWSVLRLVIGSRFIITDKLLCSELAPTPQEMPKIEFAVSCEGDTVYGVRLGFYVGDRVDDHEFYIDGRGQVIVVPLFVADHIKAWVRNKTRREEAQLVEMAAQEVNSVVTEIIEGAMAMSLNEMAAD